MVGLVLVGILDTRSLGVTGGNPGVLAYAGGVFLVLGLLVRGVATVQLGLTATEGRADDLETGGVYRYTRNPQYLGDLVAMAGWVLVTDSRLAAIVAASALPYYLLLPLAEEPWLQEHYGEDFDTYAAETPRFVGVGTVRELLE